MDDNSISSRLPAWWSQWELYVSCIAKVIYLGMWGKNVGERLYYFLLRMTPHSWAVIFRSTELSFIYQGPGSDIIGADHGDKY